MRQCRPSRAWLWFLTAAGLAAAVAGAAQPQVTVAANGRRVEVPAAAAESGLEVAVVVKGRPGPALMGRTEFREGRLAFIPVVPLLPGQTYRAVWGSGSGRQQSDFVHKPASDPVPSVTLQPQAPLPANALKFYLHFTEPMEQGVFLERLTLLDSDGREVIGPFRETELWSPDGKRLTVWFHPGRQKAGVNLNLDEGPVLLPDRRYRLTISGRWRSTAGIPLGSDQSFEIATLQADHERPRMEQWQISVPKGGTRAPLSLQFTEGLDPAMLSSGVRVHRAGQADHLTGEVQVSRTGRQWAFVPDQPWTSGGHEVRADPDLEDLAGNSLSKAFEVDRSAPGQAPTATTVPFHVD